MHDPEHWRKFDGELHCSVRAAAERLGRHRSTVQKWLPRIEAVTGAAPRRGLRHQWWIPLAAIERLAADPELLDAVRCGDADAPGPPNCVEGVYAVLAQILEATRANGVLLERLMRERGR